MSFVTMIIVCGSSGLQQLDGSRGVGGEDFGFWAVLGGGGSSNE